MASGDDVQRKRLLFRSWHRGTREMDLMLGRFASAVLADLDDAQLDRYEALLGMSDPDLYNWVTGREAIPAAHDHDVMNLLKNFKFHE